jgi:hypothetical protein
LVRVMDGNSIGLAVMKRRSAWLLIRNLAASHICVGAYNIWYIRFALAISSDCLST